MSLSLSQAKTITEAALAKGRELGLKPLSVVCLDNRASMVMVMSEDGVAQSRAHRAWQGKRRCCYWHGDTGADEPGRTAGLFHSGREWGVWR